MELHEMNLIILPPSHPIRVRYSKVHPDIIPRRLDAILLMVNGETASYVSVLMLIILSIIRIDG